MAVIQIRGWFSFELIWTSFNGAEMMEALGPWVNNNNSNNNVSYYHLSDTWDGASFFKSTL